MAGNKWIVYFFCFFLVTGRAFAVPDTARVLHNYEQAYEYLNKMLQSGSTDFKTAVYYVENAYYRDSLSYEWFDKETKKLTTLSKAYLRNNTFLYPKPDSTIVAKYAAVFKVMTDSIPIKYDDGIYYHPPYTYNFNDFDGSGNWQNMFVTTLLATHKGNCHSMPYLYKIITQELGVNTYLALAPNHIYIKLFNQKDGWYNTELTSADFPLDAWVMASGYIHLNAVQNAVYMDTLGDSKCLAMCMIDLAQGYEHLTNGIGADAFILKCCKTALQYYPNYINALLLQSKIYEKQFGDRLQASSYKSPQELINSDAKAKAQFDEMGLLVQRIHDLGYRRMPAKMYLEWLAVLKTQRDKYSNKKIATFTK